MVRVNSSETNPAGGGGLLGAGKHHVLVEGVDVTTDDKGRTQVVYDIVGLASTDPAAIGHKRKEFFYVDGKAAGRLWKFLVATGVKTQADWEESQKSGTDTEIDEQEAIGRQCCIVVRAEDYTGKDGSKKQRTETGFLFFAPDSPEAKDIPKDAEAYALYLEAKGVGPGDAAAVPATNGATNGGAANGAAPAAAGTPKKADWSKF